MILENAAPSTALAGTLARFARYVGLVAEQVEALEEKDFERVRTLGEERAALEAASLPTLDEVGGEIDLLANFQETMKDALSTLDEHLDAQRRKEEHWGALDHEALRTARAVPTLRAATGRYSELEIPASSLDRRF